MLVLTRNVSQQIIIGEMEAVIRIINVYPDGRVKIGIKAPKGTSVELKSPIMTVNDDDLYDFSSLG